MASSSPDVEAIEVRFVLQAIHERYGYDLREYDTESMKRRLQAALARTGASHLGEFQHRLLVDPGFFVTILDDLTVRVTDMFRDPGFYRALREQVVPMLKTYPQIKVWHAGCASGEEVYTTAIILAEEGLYERAQIYATDMSESALTSARSGVYAEEQMSVFRENYLRAGGKRRFEDYWSCAYDRMAIREGLRRNIFFFEHNLTTDYALGEMQVIFCRNVLIYFGDGLRERVLRMFIESLCRGGFLCLGSSEHVPQPLAGQFVRHVPGEQIYRLRGET